MKILTQRIISVILVTIAVVGGFQVLAYILNLNQGRIFFRTALWIFLYLAVKMVILFDVHFKNPSPQAIWERFEHLFNWKHFWLWLNYLALPALIFWSTVGLLYINFGALKLQQTIIVFSSFALITIYWNIKEVFYRRKEVIDRDLLVPMGMVKIYASTLAFGASLAVIRYYCLEPYLLFLGLFCITFLLVYQGLFQLRLASFRTLFVALVIAAVIAALGESLLVWWGYNYFTAAVFLGVCYNLLWGLFHYHLDHSLTKTALVEIVIVSLLVVGMIASVTNFRARIIDGCNYSMQEFFSTSN